MALEPTRQFYDLQHPQQEGVLPPGTILQQRYKILETRKVGGMAIVYKAQDLRFEKAARICAVKEMYHSAPDPRLRDLTVNQFDREANILASLSHSAVPSTYDYFSEENRLYLVMEFIDGKDLEEIIEESPGPLPVKKVLDWAIQICDVLIYLHNHQPEPIIFRDLKPTNIMLNEYEKIKVVDFGIAKAFVAGQRGTMIGTAGYPPPEQYRGTAEPRGDIYALGATMHHLLTKRDPRLEPPFTFHEHPIHQMNPEASETLNAIVMKALEYDIDKRYATAEEFQQALKTQLDPAAAVGAAAASTIAFDTSLITSVQTGDATAIWEFTCEDEIRSSPTVSDGIVYVGSYDHNLYAIDAKDGTFIWKFPTEAGISSSPYVWEGLVLVGSEDRMMYAIIKDTGRIGWSTPTQDRIRGSSPRVAMAHVFFGSDDHCLYNLDARNGRLLWKFETEGQIHSSPAVTEELVYFGSDDTGLYALESRTRRIKWRYPTNRPVLSSPLLYEGLIFFGSLDWNIYAVDAQAGWSVWNYRTRSWITSSPAVSESLGLVYIGSGDRRVYAFDYSRGSSPVWTFETEGQIGSSPAVTEEAVYIGSSDGHLYSLDARTGELRWKFFTGAVVVSSPVVSENMVYIGSTNSKLYALLL